jgi:hypothetical protein
MMRPVLVFAVTFAFVAGTLVFIFSQDPQEDLEFSHETMGASPGADSLDSKYHEEGFGVYRFQVESIDLKSGFDGVLLVAKDDEVVFKKANEQHAAEKLFTAMGTLTEACVIRLDQSLAHLLPFFAKQKGNRHTIHCLLSNALDLPYYTGHRAWNPEGHEFQQEYAPEE